jgi:hypothetical protein
MTSPAEGPRTLAALQDFLRLSTATPGGLPAGLRRARERYGETMPFRVPVGVDPRARLSIYARGYLDRLLACLRADYPAVRVLLGDSLFERFAVDYLQAYPPRSYSLFTLGAGFAAHLAATRPADDVVPAERRALLDLPIDLAKVERARLEALRAPGLEQQEVRPETPYDLLLDTERVITRAPCLRLVECRHDVRAFLSAVDRDEPPGAPPAQKTLLAVSRMDFHPTLTPLEEWQRAALELCETPRPLRELSATLATELGEDEGATLADLSLWLPLARQQGLFMLPTISL